jgi:hypothetical protein
VKTSNIQVHAQVRYISSCISLLQLLSPFYTNYILSVQTSQSPPATVQAHQFRSIDHLTRHSKSASSHLKTNAFSRSQHGTGTLRHVWYFEAIWTSAAATLTLKWQVSAQLKLVFRPHKHVGHRQFGPATTTTDHGEASYADHQTPPPIIRGPSDSLTKPSEMR